MFRTFAAFVRRVRSASFSIEQLTFGSFTLLLAMIAMTSIASVVAIRHIDATFAELQHLRSLGEAAEEIDRRTKELRLAARDLVTDPAAPPDRVWEAASSLNTLLKNTRLKLAPEQQEMIDGVSLRLANYREGMAASALGACAAILFQSSVDFGVELLGLAVPVVLVATTLLGARLRESRSPGMVLARGATVLALGGAALVLALPITRSVQEDHDEVAASADPSLAMLHEMIERHPLDYLAYGETAAVLLRAGDPRAAKFLNHALTLHPTHPGLHRLAARMLIASGRRSQGAIEYALALRGTLAPSNLVVEIVTLLPEAELAASAIPIDAINHAQILRSLDQLRRNEIGRVHVPDRRHPNTAGVAEFRAKYRCSRLLEQRNLHFGK